MRDPFRHWELEHKLDEALSTSLQASSAALWASSFTSLEARICPFEVSHRLICGPRKVYLLVSACTAVEVPSFKWTAIRSAQFVGAPSCPDPRGTTTKSFGECTLGSLSPRQDQIVRRRCWPQEILLGTITFPLGAGGANLFRGSLYDE